LHIDELLMPDDEKIITTSAPTKFGFAVFLAFCGQKSAVLFFNQISTVSWPEVE
jgi:hypothetical protein